MTHFRLSVSALAMLAGAAPGIVQAQDVLDLGTVTIYTYQTATDLNRTGATVDVVDEDDIKRSATTGAAEALERLPGVSTTTSGGIGAPTALRIRGLPDRYTTVYYGGIEIADPTGPYSQFDWANVLPGAISRAEVIRGSQSARFGANAVAGAVALSGATAPEEGEILQFGLEYGSYNTRRGHLTYGAASGRAGFAIGLATLATDGFSAVKAPGFTEDDGFTGKQISVDAYADLTDDLRVGLTGFWYDGRGEYDGGPFITVPESGVTETRSKGLRAYAELATGAVDHVFELTSYAIDRTLTTSGSLFSAPVSSFVGERQTAAYTGTWRQSDDLTLTYGLEWKREDAESAPDAIETKALLAEALWAPLDTLDVALSLRHDDHSLYGGQNSARLALAWHAMPDLTVRGVVSTGYRAPSLDELFNTGYGNPNLTPETSRSYELGVKKGFANGASVSLTLFQTEIDDLISYFDPDGFGPLPGGYAQVGGTSTTKGVELAGFVPLGAYAEIEGSYTYTDARDAADVQLQRVPEHDFALTLSGRFGDAMTGAVTVQHMAGFADTFGIGFAAEPVDDFTVVNARFGYAFADGFEAYVRVENLLDADYERIPDYQTAGRSVFFGIDANF